MSNDDRRPTTDDISGVLGLFADPHELMEGGAALRQAHFTGMDAFTPFPVHGIDKVLGLKKSWISAVTFFFALFGCLGGLLFQVWVSAIAWPINVGGKPMYSIPAFIPITFETTILFGGIATFIAALSFCGLPRRRPWKTSRTCGGEGGTHQALPGGGASSGFAAARSKTEGFAESTTRAPVIDPRVTADAFALWVPATEPDRIAKAHTVLKEHGAYETRLIGES